MCDNVSSSLLCLFFVKMTNLCVLNNNHGDTNSPYSTNQHYRLMKTSSMWSKRHDQYLRDNRETNG